MSILAFSKEHATLSYRTAAVLLAMLPYGCAEKRVLKLLFDSDSVCSTVVKRATEHGLITPQSITRKESKHEYNLCYFTITPDGVRVLAKLLGTELPWLEILAVLVEKQAYTVRGRMNADSFVRFLRSQTANVFFSLSEKHTIIESLLYAPQIAMPVLQQFPAGSFASLVYNAISAEPTGQSIKTPFYVDLKSLHLGKGSPYQTDARKPMTVQRLEIQDPLALQNPHVGIFRGGKQDYFVYMSDRGGIKWNSGLLRRCEPELLRQLYYAGSDRFDMIPEKGFPTILLFGSKKELLRAVSTKKSSPKRYTLGDGAGELHCIPLTPQGLHLLREIDKHPLLDRDYGAYLRGKIDGLAWDAREPWTPYRYHDLPLASGVSMDWKKLSRCRDGGIGLLCWAWQVEYLRTVFPDVRIFVPSVKRGRLVECP